LKETIFILRWMEEACDMGADLSDPRMQFLIQHILLNGDKLFKHLLNAEILLKGGSLILGHRLSDYFDAIEKHRKLSKKDCEEMVRWNLGIEHHYLCNFRAQRFTDKRTLLNALEKGLDITKDLVLYPEKGERPASLLDGVEKLLKLFQGQSVHVLKALADANGAAAPARAGEERKI
jgi:hypothetical protein